MSCRTARRHARAFHQPENNDTQLNCSEGGSCTFRGYRCRTTATRAATSHRCTKGSRIIRWKYRYVSGA